MDDGPVVAGRSSGMEFQDDKTQMLDEMQCHGRSIDERTDSIGGQLHSCVANGKLYCESDMAILASVLKGVDITEVYSPERVTRLCTRYGLIAGDSFDLRDGWDLSDEVTQSRVIQRIKSTRPSLVVGSPPCTWLSTLQQLNLHVLGPSWREKYDREKAKAVKHIEFCLMLFVLQRDRGA